MIGMPRDQPSEFCRDESPAQIRNTLELQVFGLRRSGNHAVIAWLAQQYERPIVFLNNIRPFRDPFTHFLMGRVPNAIPIGKMDADETERLRAERKNLLLLSYEDINLRKLARADLLPERDTWLGQSGRIQSILLFRD